MIAAPEFDALVSEFGDPAEVLAELVSVPDLPLPRIAAAHQEDGHE